MYVQISLESKKRDLQSTKKLYVVKNPEWLTTCIYKCWNRPVSSLAIPFFFYNSNYDLIFVMTIFIVMWLKHLLLHPY